MNEILKQNKTAFYVFDVKTLKDRVAYLRKMLPEDVAICYAIKANTFITAELENDVDRFEICSPGEAEICDSLDIPDKMMVISGVYKTPEVMENMVANGKCDRIFTVESLTQFNLFRELSEKYKKKISLLLRLTNGSQFGINSDEIEEIISKRNEFEYLDILGIQFFSGTQKTSLKKLKREIDKLDNLLILLKEKYDYTAENLILRMKSHIRQSRFSLCSDIMTVGRIFSSRIFRLQLNILRTRITKVITLLKSLSLRQIRLSRNI